MQRLVKTTLCTAVNAAELSPGNPVGGMGTESATAPAYSIYHLVFFHGDRDRSAKSAPGPEPRNASYAGQFSLHKKRRMDESRDLAVVTPCIPWTWNLRGGVQ